MLVPRSRATFRRHDRPRLTDNSVSSHVSTRPRSLTDWRPTGTARLGAFGALRCLPTLGDGGGRLRRGAMCGGVKVAIRARTVFRYCWTERADRFVAMFGPAGHGPKSTCFVSEGKRRSVECCGRRGMWMSAETEASTVDARHQPHQLHPCESTPQTADVVAPVAGGPRPLQPAGALR
jgi:hypothetical protein